MVLSKSQYPAFNNDNKEFLTAFSITNSKFVFLLMRAPIKCIRNKFIISETEV